MKRHAAGSAALLLVACVGANPRWDGPAVESADPSGDSRGGGPSPGHSASASTADPSEDDDATSSSESSGAGEASTSSASDAVTTAPGTDGGTSSAVDEGPGSEGEPVTDDGGLPCPVGLLLCSGLCVDADQDKHACGPECIDCTERFGNAAQCHAGECAPHPNHDDEGGGDDGGDD